MSPRYNATAWTLKPPSTSAARPCGSRCSIGAPVLLAGLVVGLLIGLMQALTQIQEQTVSFVPKLVAMVVVLALALPWLIDQLVEYSRQLIGRIPDNL